MSRKKRDHSRTILPDPKFGDKLVSKFINCLMMGGKKSVSESIFYDALDKIAERKEGEESINIFKTAVDNVRPLVEVRSRRVGGATYQIPTEVRPVRRDTLAIRWLIQGARARSEKTMRDRLAGELLDALDSRGSAIKKKDEIHRMAEANRAFAHYRW